MKKIFTLVAVACMAWSANAETESWSVANADGTLKAEYVANADASKASVVEFSTTNVSGTQVSGPNAGYTDAEKTPLEPILDNGWSSLQTKALSADGSVAPFYYVNGKGNPVNIEKVTWEEIVSDGDPTGKYRADWKKSYYNPDGSADLPDNGTYVTVTPKVDGSMKVSVWINKSNRETFVVKKSDAKALAYGSEVKVSGYINGQNNDVEEGSPLFGYPKFQESIAVKGEGTAEDTNEGTKYLEYIIGAGNQAAWVYLTWDAKANETYYIFNKSAQVGFGGYEFTPGGTGGIDDVIAADENAPVEYFNLQGVRVENPQPGIYVKRQGNKVSKVVVR